MIFILDQRLRAQSIAKAKAQKVLLEIMRFMLSETFLVELFKPQKMHTYSATKHLFNKLAHSSVMKLNENSMSKLFDLMVMGFKQQIISTTTPEELYHVTVTHLDEMLKIIDGTGGETYIHTSTELFRKMTENFNSFDYSLIKQHLLSFFQDKHVKVSLFIQEGIQSLDGTLNIDIGGKGPIFSQEIGEIFYNIQGIHSKVNIG